MADIAVAARAAELGASVAAAQSGGRRVSTPKSNPGDVLTPADTAAEDAVVRYLTELRPGDGLVAEEGSHRDGRRLWVVDPLDGSMNFVLGDPFWCSAVALVDRSGPLVAAVHHRAAGETFVAKRGEGTWLGGRRVRLRACRDLTSAVVATYIEADDLCTSAHARLASGSATVRVRGSGSLEMAWIAAGRGDCWFARDMEIWDRAPGELLVSEAGGSSLTWEADGVTWFAAGHRNAVRALRDRC